MRLLWSCVLGTGLFLIGLQVYEGRRAAGTTPATAQMGAIIHTPLEDGSPYPTPPPQPKTK